MIFWFSLEIEVTKLAESVREEEIWIDKLDSAFLEFFVSFFTLVFDSFSLLEPHKEILQLFDPLQVDLFGVEGAGGHMGFFFFDQPFVDHHQRFGWVFGVDGIGVDGFIPIDVFARLLRVFNQFPMSFLHEGKNLREFGLVLDQDLQGSH